MTKEIEQAARALINTWEDLKFFRCSYKRASDLLAVAQCVKKLEQALNPKPSREDVILLLQSYNDWRRGAELSEDLRPHPKKIGEAIDSAIELLQEPQKGGWIKCEEGMQIPDCKKVLLKWSDGSVDIARPSEMFLGEGDRISVLEYMIIE